MLSSTISTSKLPRDCGFFSEVSLSKLKHVGQGVTKVITNQNIININKTKDEDSCLQILSSLVPLKTKYVCAYQEPSMNKELQKAIMIRSRLIRRPARINFKSCIIQYVFM